MEKTDKRYQAYIDILREELIPAMGCTEPIAVAYAAAAARNTLGELPDKVLVEASGSMIKNVKSVIVPNTDNMKGLEAAAAAGIVAGKQEKKLEVIADVTPEQTKAIRAYLDQTDIKVRHVENGVTFDIILTVWKGEHSAQVRIAVFHTNIVHVEKDGEVLVDIPVHGDSEETLTDRSWIWSISGTLPTRWTWRMSVPFWNRRSGATWPLPRRVCGAATVPTSAVCCWIWRAMM